MKMCASVSELAQLAPDTISNNALNAVQAMESMQQRPHLVPERGPGDTIYYRLRSSTPSANGQPRRREKLWIGKLTPQELCVLESHIQDTWPPDEIPVRELWIQQMRTDRIHLINEARELALCIGCNFRGFKFLINADAEMQIRAMPKTATELLVKLAAIRELTIRIEHEHKSILIDCVNWGQGNVSMRRLNRAQSGLRAARSARGKTERAIKRLHALFVASAYEGGSSC